MIRVENAGRYLRLLVDTEMLNLEKPVKIFVDERIHTVLVRPSRKTQMETIKQRGDPRYIFDGSITLARTLDGVDVSMDDGIEIFSHVD